MSDMFDRYEVIDVDTHMTEPPNVWTDRASSKCGDRVLHVVRMGKVDMWMIGDEPLLPRGQASSAVRPREYAQKALCGLPEVLIGKILEGNAARVYHLPTD